MIMVQLGIALNEAMARMRAYAYAESRPLGEIARNVVTRRLRFDQDLSMSGAYGCKVDAPSPPEPRPWCRGR
jgi:hypothetical protein